MRGGVGGGAGVGGRCLGGVAMEVSATRGIQGGCPGAPLAARQWSEVSRCRRWGGRCSGVLAGFHLRTQLPVALGGARWTGREGRGGEDLGLVSGGHTVVAWEEATPRNGHRRRRRECHG
jgi:hypothetical protein